MKLQTFCGETRGVLVTWAVEIISWMVLEPYEDGSLHFLIHTGSRNESGHVDAFVNDPDRFDNEFERVTLGS